MTAASLLYSAAQVRALDAQAIAHGTSGYTLMRRAGETALRALRSRWPTALQVSVVAGGGNNGGDGYVLARFAQAAGLNAAVLAVTPPERLAGDARTAWQDFRASGGQVLAYSAAPLAQADVIVDALLGTGLNSDVRAPIATAIADINASARPVLSLDLPSGLNADSGAVMGAAVRADCTISFVALKTGLFLGDGPEYAGRLLFDDLEVAVPDEPGFTALLERLGEGEIARALPSRRRQANKGDFGRVLIVGGGAGMPGAARLAGESCLRVGAGLVTVASARENQAMIAVGRPELIVHAVDHPDELAPLLQAADVVAIGPGLGRSEWAQRLLERTLTSGKRLVIDADRAQSAGREAAHRPRGRGPHTSSRRGRKAARHRYGGRAGRSHGGAACVDAASSGCSHCAQGRRHAAWHCACRGREPDARDLRARQSGHGGRRHGGCADRGDRRHSGPMRRSVAGGTRRRDGARAGG